MDRPTSGWRRTVHSITVRYGSAIINFFWGYRTNMTDHEDADYSKYLGPDFKKTAVFKGVRVSTYVSNHIGFLENTAFCSVKELPPAFCPMAETRKFPIGQFYLDSLQCYYVDRKCDKAGLDRQVEAMGARQREIQSDADTQWGGLTIYAEGGVTNGTCISRFRRGAF